MIRYFLFLFISTNVFAGGFVGGNGGEGIDDHGRLYVRDLYSIGAHTSPWFGDAVDPHLPPLPKFTFAYPRNLLARKLTDLNEGTPGLGDFLLMAIKQYTWTLVDAELNLADSLRDPVKIPPGIKIKHIAGRFGHSIRINKVNWMKLNDENKVALIIHEAVFSLLEPTADPNGFFSQSSEVARELTGQFFIATFKGSGIAENLATHPSLYGLNVPAMTSLEIVRKFLRVALAHEDTNNRFRITERRFARKESAKLSDFWNEACEQNGNSMIVDAWLAMPTISATSYRVASDTFQIGLSISLTEDEIIAQKMVFSSRENCRSSIPGVLTDFFSHSRP